MRRWAAALLVAALCIGGGVAWAASRGSTSSTKYLTAAVTRGTVAQTVAATGSVEPSATLALSFGGSTATAGSSSAGSGSSTGSNSNSARSVSSGSTDVTSVSAHVGEKVAAGVTLARLDDTAAEAQLASADSQLSSARARQAAEPSGTSQTTIDSDAAAVAQAEQQVESAQAALDATVLKAPVDGIITDVELSVGLPPTSPGITMRTDSLGVTAQVSEDDIPLLAAGQKATVTFPALSTSTTGTLGSLPTAAAATTSGGGGSAVTFAVTINLPHPPARLLPGMTAQISIVIAERDNVLNVPTSAVGGSSTAPTVQVMGHGKPVTKAVEIGLTTNSTTEILAGLSLGDVVVTGEVNPTTGATTTGTGGGLGGTGGGFGGGGLGGNTGFRGNFRGGTGTGTRGGTTGGAGG